MKSRVLLKGMILILFGVAGCGPSAETPREEPAPLTKEGLYVRGQKFWIERQADSAAAYFLRSAAMDSSFHQPLRDLAQMQYERALQEPDKSRKRTMNVCASSPPRWATTACS
jgi:hypothetical protein